MLAKLNRAVIIILLFTLIVFLVTPAPASASSVEAIILGVALFIAPVIIAGFVKLFGNTKKEPAPQISELEGSQETPDPDNLPASIISEEVADSQVVANQN